MRINKNKGFTLLEALVSLAIIALALTVILKAQFYNLKVCSETKNTLLAKMLLQKKMAEVELGEELYPHLSPPLSRGRVKEGGEDFSWVLNSEEVKEGLKEVNLTISWKEGALIKDFCVTTYLLTANKAE